MIGIIVIIIGVLVLLSGAKLPPIKIGLPYQVGIPLGFVLILIGAIMEGYLPWPF